jgi:hypothetical protein
VITDDGSRWADYLIAQGISKKIVRDVWIASFKATVGFLVERRKLNKNRFAGIRIRGAKGTKRCQPKGLHRPQHDPRSTLTTSSHLTTPETRAARRWVPWVTA